MSTRTVLERTPVTTVPPRRRLLSFVSNTFAYGAGMLLLAVVALFLIPSMVRNSGPDAWSAVASGQAIGAIAATVIGYGWGLTGPAAVAAAPRARWRALFLESLAVKLTIFLPSMALSAALALAVNANFGLYAVLGCASAGLIGLSSEWFYIGMNKPWWIFGLEVLPRVVGGGLGIALMELRASDARGALFCQIAGIVVGQTLAAAFLLFRVLRPTTGPGDGWMGQATSAYRGRHRAVGRHHVAGRARRGGHTGYSERAEAQRRQPRRNQLLALLLSHRHGVSSQAVATGYMALPIVIVSAFSPGALATFAVLDKAQKQIVTIIQPGVTAIQGLTPDPDRRRLAANSRVAALTGLAAAAALVVFLLLVGPTFLRWLGAGQIHFVFGQVALVALNAALVLMDSVISRGILPAFGRVDVIARASAVGAVVGLAAVFLLAPTFGATGALVGFGIGVAVRLVWQALTLASELRRV